MNTLTLKHNKNIYSLIQKNNIFLLKITKNNKVSTEELEIKNVFDRMNLIEKETGEKFKFIKL
jgi:hypothetical protein